MRMINAKLYGLLVALMLLPASASAQSIFRRAEAIVLEAGSTIPLIIAILAGIVGGVFLVWAIILMPKLGDQRESNKGGVAVLIMLLILGGGGGLAFGFMTGLAAYTVSDRAPSNVEGLRRFDG